MAKLYACFSDWEQYHGRKVLIDGLSYVIKVFTYSGIYPYPARWISVMAEPTEHTMKSDMYRAERAKLGDDWSYDVLDSDDVYVDILKQLGVTYVSIN